MNALLFMGNFWTQNHEGGGDLPCERRKYAFNILSKYSIIIWRGEGQNERDEGLIKKKGYFRRKINYCLVETTLFQFFFF
jgi:hypothetical protein